MKTRKRVSTIVNKILARVPELERENIKAILAKYRAGKAAKWEQDKLAALGLVEPHKPDATAGLSDCTSLAELAGQLSRYFEGRIAIELSAPALCQWRKGRGLPIGAPLPPAKTSNRHCARKWADWIEQWLIPEHGGDTAGRSVFLAAAEAKAQRQIDEAAGAAIQRRVLEEQYAPVETHREQLRSIGATINQAITTYMEKRAVEAILKALEGTALTEAQTEALRLTLTTACEAAADALRAFLRDALRKTEPLVEGDYRRECRTDAEFESVKKALSPSVLSPVNDSLNNYAGDAQLLGLGKQ